MEKKVSTTREDDEIESCNICGKVLAFPGLRADPLFINGEVVPRLISKIPSENISRERLYEKAHRIYKMNALTLRRNMSTAQIVSLHAWLL